MAAPDVGDGGAGPQLILDALQRRDPRRGEEGAVGRPKQPLAAGIEVGIVIAPANAGTAAKRIGQRVGRPC